MDHFIKVRVQKGVPLPEASKRGAKGINKGKYPWREMNIGDSFVFPAAIGRAAYASAVQASKNGMKFVVRKTDEGFRCWRQQ